MIENINNDYGGSNMIFSCKKRLFPVLISVLLAGIIAGVGYRLTYYSSGRTFLERHALPDPVKKQFKSFFKSNNLDADFFKSSEKIIEQRLTDLGFERTASGSNSLVMKCPKQLGNFVVKAPGRFHDVTRDVVQAPLENVTRAVGADRLNDYAQQANLKQVKAVDEYLFRIPGASKELSDYHYLVIEPFLDLDAEKSFADFSDEQFKETVDAICAIDYSDTSTDNIVMDKQGQIFFLDISERDYLTSYKNLPDELYFPGSESEGDESDAATSSISYEEQLGQVLCESKDAEKNKAGQMVSKKLDVIFHGLMPLSKEKIDAEKRAYLQETLDYTITCIERLVQPFKDDQELQSVDHNLKSLRTQIDISLVSA